MDREEAIAILKNRDMHGVPCGYTSGYSEALDMAIEALSAEPSGELIRREDAIEAVRNYISDNDYGDDGDIGMDAGLELAVGVIKALPSADRPHGERR